MAHFQNQYGPVCQTDAYGNPILLTTDEYGNPIHLPPVATYGGAPEEGTDFGRGDYKKQHGKIHRSGASSSSSSSSEDYGEGGRREKKGIKEKIKGKLPGHHKDQSHATSTTTPGGYSSADDPHHLRKKGIMDKIKEKLPGSHHHHHH